MLVLVLHNIKFNFRPSKCTFKVDHRREKGICILYFDPIGFKKVLSLSNHNTPATPRLDSTLVTKFVFLQFFIRIKFHKLHLASIWLDRTKWIASDGSRNGCNGYQSNTTQHTTNNRHNSAVSATKIGCDWMQSDATINNDWMQQWMEQSDVSNIIESARLRKTSYTLHWHLVYCCVSLCCIITDQMIN